MMNQLRSKDGFTLVEIMISLAIILTAALAFMATSSLVMKQVALTVRGEQMNAVMDRIDAAFGDDERFCTAILGGTELSPNSSVTTPFESFHFTNASGVDGANIVTSGDAVVGVPDLIVKNLHIRTAATLGANKNLVNIEITFSHQDGSRGFDVVRKFPFYAIVRDGRITSCSATPWTTWTLYDRICRIDGRGFRHYNPETNACEEDPEVIWTPGENTASATCDDDQRVAVDDLNYRPEQLNWMLCKVTATKVSVLPPRNYEGGIYDAESSPSFVASFDPVTRSCQFNYVVGVPTAGFQTAIRCIDE